MKRNKVEIHKPSSRKVEIKEYQLKLHDHVQPKQKVTLTVTATKFCKTFLCRRVSAEERKPLWKLDEESVILQAKKLIGCLS